MHYRSEPVFLDKRVENDQIGGMTAERRIVFAKWAKVPNWLLVLFFGFGIYFELSAPYHQPVSRELTMKQNRQALKPEVVRR